MSSAQFLWGEISINISAHTFNPLLILRLVRFEPELHSDSRLEDLTTTPELQS